MARRTKRSPLLDVGRLAIPGLDATHPPSHIPETYMVSAERKAPLRDHVKQRELTVEFVAVVGGDYAYKKEATELVHQMLLALGMHGAWKLVFVTLTALQGGSRLRLKSSQQHGVILKMRPGSQDSGAEFRLRPPQAYTPLEVWTRINTYLNHNAEEAVAAGPVVTTQQQMANLMPALPALTVLDDTPQEVLAMAAVTDIPPVVSNTPKDDSPMSMLEQMYKLKTDVELLRAQYQQQQVVATKLLPLTERITALNLELEDAQRELLRLNGQASQFPLDLSERLLQAEAKWSQVEAGLAMMQSVLKSS